MSSQPQPRAQRDPLTVTHPEVLDREWAYPENRAAGLHPDQLTSGSGKQVWRLAPCCGVPHQVFIEPWLRRGRQPRCPNCVPNNLTVTHPETLEREWAYPENDADGLDPTRLVARGRKSRVSAWRRSPCCGRVHRAPINTWFAKDNPRICPDCNRDEPLTLTHPELLDLEWAYPENETAGLDPARLTAASHKQAWRIPSCCGVPHQAIIANWFYRGRVPRCPACVPNNLTVTHPEVLEREWAYAENETAGLEPLLLTSGSGRKAWRIPPCCGVPHQAVITHWIGKTGGVPECPVCDVADPLTLTHREVLAVEWMYPENEAEGLDPAHLSAGSFKLAWLRPPCCNIAQPRRIADRFLYGGSECMECSTAGTSIQETRLFEELATYYPTLAQDVAIARTGGGRNWRVDMTGEAVTSHMSPHEYAHGERVRFVVEFDGEYWHGPNNPTGKPREPFDRDKADDLRAQGYKVIRVREGALALLHPDDIQVPAGASATLVAELVVQRLTGLGLPPHSP